MTCAVGTALAEGRYPAEDVFVGVLPELPTVPKTEEDPAIELFAVGTELRVAVDVARVTLEVAVEFETVEFEVVALTLQCKTRNLRVSGVKRARNVKQERRTHQESGAKTSISLRPTLVVVLLTPVTVKRRLEVLRGGEIKTERPGVPAFGSVPTW